MALKFEILLSVLLVTLTALSSSGPVGPLLVGDALDSTLLDTQEFLSHFLSKLNQTGGRQPEQRPLAFPKEPSEYMLELFERFANDRTAMTSANIVRSFKNEDSSSYSETAIGVRTHPLLFNISVPSHEHITVAELRLFTLIQRAQRPFAGRQCKVTIYKVNDGGVWTSTVSKEVGRRDQDESSNLEEVVTKHIYAKDKSWVSLDMTRAVVRWRKYGHSTLKLEVRVTILGPEESVTWGENEDVIDIERNVEGKHNAVMIVFSDDPNKRDSVHEKDHAKNSIFETPARIRRGVKSEPCKRTPLFVDFKDIGWDSWIIQPVGYEAYKCIGVCSQPMTSEVSPTKHAIVQTLLSVKSPERASRACCVPTKLEPISLLYYDNGVITFNHKYEGMVVTECGCR
ncbi:bone morphogenetic protein 10-like [Corythoichthys intestinalis]|uniref:bone morphogenetic protein 10-like n=1 Tax=Corythoichthys intestinalis TaxID=161448 RepID=UPI0025A51A17|nr:bone morphogenetic protein 10-like [Corythoichthys intestinalis]XP_061800191.1 bone morphogenetic protein 10-like [Nerophis lumbriciformis]